MEELPASYPRCLGRPATLVSRLGAEQFVLYPAERALALPVRRSEFSSRIIGASSRCSAAAGRPTVVVGVARSATTTEFVEAQFRSLALGVHVMGSAPFGVARARARLLVSFFVDFRSPARGGRSLALSLC